jgi:pimeloyl-ACP methyl ester carboxylesterase/class 3 adenylate cyclase
VPGKTRYATNGDVSVAYQVVGDGPRDLLLTTGWVVPMESIWDDPLYAEFVDRLTSFSRVIMWDKRGTGMSDRVSADALPTLEDRMEDLNAVLEAAGARDPALVGLSEGALLCALFAATYPERLSALVFYGGWASSLPKGDSPGIMRQERAGDFIREVRETWGDSGELLRLWAPSVIDDARVQAWWNRALTTGASPSAAVAWLQMAAGMDIRAALPAISAPTLVVHRSDDRIIPVENGRYVAKQIPNAKYVEQPGQDHLWWFGNQEAFLDEIEEFLTGSREGGDARRALMTILFTDVVDSTKRLSELGDRRWRELSAAHHRDVRTQLERFRGREVNAMGDGYLATFDGPARAIRSADAILERSRELGLSVRAGLHTGECELIGDEISGIAVNIGARVGALAEGGEVLVSSTVRDLVIGSGIEFADRGTHALKGVPGEWRVFAVTGT